MCFQEIKKLSFYKNSTQSITIFLILVKTDTTKNHSFLILFLLITINFSCSSDDSQTIQSFWVDSERVSCVGEGINTCYRVQENPNIDKNAWSFFYDSIEVFDELYEEGYIYNINVTVIDVHNLPQDASSSRFVLNKIISKEILNKKSATRNGCAFYYFQLQS